MAASTAPILTTAETVMLGRDPFLEDQDDPRQCHALESSLWELKVHICSFSILFFYLIFCRFLFFCFAILIFFIIFCFVFILIYIATILEILSSLYLFVCIIQFFFNVPPEIVQSLSLVGHQASENI